MLLFSILVGIYVVILLLIVNELILILFNSPFYNSVIHSTTLRLLTRF
nr:MAG TPA: hypothetical protein [Caudoviricetes sp.]